MSNIEEKKAFSDRLKSALTDSGHPLSPTYLSNNFNARFSGEPISVQSANNWLLGKAIPSQDKLTLLSVWLKVSAQWLRFGSDPDLNNQTTILSIQLDNESKVLLNKYSQLTRDQKLIIDSLLREFLKT